LLKIFAIAFWESIFCKNKPTAKKRSRHPAVKTLHFYHYNFSRDIGTEKRILSNEANLKDQHSLTSTETITKAALLCPLTRTYHL